MKNEIQPVISDDYKDYGNTGGTGQYYFNPLFPNYQYTDGVRDFAIKEKSWWLIDAILSHAPKVIDKHFYIFYCHVEGGQAIIFGQRDIGEPVEIFQRIEATDLKHDAKFWLVGQYLITPNEY